jgi:hypothetical protein
MKHYSIIGYGSLVSPFPVFKTAKTFKQALIIKQAMQLQPFNIIEIIECKKAQNDNL